jgi:ornithine cyclodeaminase/alanine dehydrogenase
MKEHIAFVRAAGILMELTEIGDVLTGKAPGRISPAEITVFDSTGIALQDLASAAVILVRAESEGAGLTAEL